MDEDIIIGVAWIALVVGIGVLLIHLAFQKQEDIKRDECYEIYATDNIVLKKCEQYFKD